ncbi:oligosaccharide flippase family protein [uncultured Rhodoblastus sp.]|uniref:oligosaccharide flippase family protein n=1 Tax=uncultured Rhodoblastus sp. TaxID=543037 RepID=UPI0025DFA233|nr:oligosaccharide flippase family protein [uncultured Rhodoblastus sp.]
MTSNNVIKKSQSLIVIAGLEISLPFLRMLIMTRALDLPELGFASALAATYGMFEQVTDIAMYRYVYSLPRDEYVEALASAQALSVLRGFAVALFAYAVSPLIADAFSLHAEWRDFALLAAVILIRSFENLEPRVAERDYHFRPQLICIVAANALCLGALIAALAIWHNHLALTASLVGQAIGGVVASHFVSRLPYRLNFFSPHFFKAFRFGYPLMFNGVGLAISSQGDRFLVGAMLGLPALGVYSVVMLATILPINMVYRVMGSLTSAALFNAGDLAENWTRKVRLAARLSPLLAAGYAVGVLTLTNIVLPIVFGPKFQISILGLSLLAFSAYFRIARGEPFGSLLLMSQRTKRLAIGNLSNIFALVLSAILLYYARYVESALAGRALGEVVSFGVTLFLTRNLMRGAEKDLQFSVLLGFLVISSASLLTFVTTVGLNGQPTMEALADYAIVFACWAALAARPFFNVMAPRGQSATPNSEDGSSDRKAGSLSATAGKNISPPTSDSADSKQIG